MRRLALAFAILTACCPRETTRFRPIAPKVAAPVSGLPNHGVPRSSPDLEASRVRAKELVAWLAAPEREGRGVGGAGIEDAARFIEGRFAELGLEPAGAAGYRQAFDVVTALERGADDVVSVDAATLGRDAFSPLGFSAPAKVSARAVFAGYGVVSEVDRVDDYRDLDVRGKVVVVRRFVAKDKVAATADRARHGDLRRKAWLAKARGAVGLVVVDSPERNDSELEEPFPSLEPDGEADAGIPAVIVGREALAPTLERLKMRAPVKIELAVGLRRKTASAANLVGRLASDVPVSDRLPGVLVIGAHYDHLGHGGPASLAPDSHDAHLGADDNASGVAGMLEAARALATMRGRRRDIVFVAFSGEEMGILGSSRFVKEPLAGLEPANVVAMLNLDMIGRLREDHVDVFGGDSAREWPELVSPLCGALGLRCNVAGSGHGPSDHESFFSAGVPVLHFFTGGHADYHRPSDVPERVDPLGVARISRLVATTAWSVVNREGRLTLRVEPPKLEGGDVRSARASLGTIPDYGGPPRGQRGVLLSGVRAGGPAEKAGLRRGDILVELGPHAVGDVHELMFALGELRPGDKVKARLVRDGHIYELDVTMGRVGAHH